MLKKSGLFSILVIAMLSGCSAGDATSAQSDATESSAVGSQGQELKSPPLPSPTLAVPDDSRVAFYFDAIGVQIYSCQAKTDGYAWTFQAPEASLFDRRGHLVVKHYGGPTWESAIDHSSVVAKKIAEFSAHADAIPELLLQATTHDGPGVMDDVTYIQRLDTAGGLAPTAGCDAAHVGASARVDYTATYFFSRPKANCN
ncbi:MAG TPA: DUF3455 domain-containing protein [Polyangiaceae bacterium]|nr:DUF3455 domain-containing protein [Polyangiaceae bacterium]HYQ30567.1 DUF3455 domain-containing protein [Polyangiaceae bacterium]